MNSNLQADCNLTNYSDSPLPCPWAELPGPQPSPHPLPSPARLQRQAGGRGGINPNGTPLRSVPDDERKQRSAEADRRPAAQGGRLQSAQTAPAAGPVQADSLRYLRITASAAPAPSMSTSHGDGVRPGTNDWWTSSVTA